MQERDRRRIVEHVNESNEVLQVLIGRTPEGGTIVRNRDDEMIDFMQRDKPDGVARILRLELEFHERIAKMRALKEVCSGPQHARTRATEDGPARSRTPLDLLAAEYGGERIWGEEWPRRRTEAELRAGEAEYLTGLEG